MFVFKTYFLLLSVFVLSISFSSIHARPGIVPREYDDEIDDGENEIFDEEIWKEKRDGDVELEDPDKEEEPIDDGKHDEEKKFEDDEEDEEKKFEDDEEDEEKKFEDDEEEKKFEDDEEKKFEDDEKEKKIEDEEEKKIEDEEEKKIEDEEEGKKIEDEEEEKKIEDEEEEKKIEDEEKSKSNEGRIKFVDEDEKDESGVVRDIMDEKLGKEAEQGGKAKGYISNFYEKLKNFFRKRFSQN